MTPATIGRRQVDRGGDHAVMQQWIPACAGMTEREDSHTRSAGQDEPAPRIHSLPGPAGWDCQKGNRRSSRNVSATRILVVSSRPDGSPPFLRELTREAWRRLPRNHHVDDMTLPWVVVE